VRLRAGDDPVGGSARIAAAIDVPLLMCTRVAGDAKQAQILRAQNAQAQASRDGLELRERDIGWIRSTTSSLMKWVSPGGGGVKNRGRNCGRKPPAPADIEGRPVDDGALAGLVDGTEPVPRSWMVALPPTTIPPWGRSQPVPTPPLLGANCLQSPAHSRVACGIRGIADRIPTQAGQHSDDCGQPMRAG
jgi:hypothetical protein